MQKEGQRTPKSKRSNKITPGTPDRLNSTSLESLVAPRAKFNSRSTMPPGDFAVPGLVPTKRLLSFRQSMMPPSTGQSSLDTTRRPEPESKNLEMELLYDKYLQTKMIELLMKKKKEEMEKALTVQLVTLAKEEDASSEQLLMMKTKEKDLRDLTEQQENLDAQIEEFRACIDELRENPMKILSQLESMLVSLDTLRCKNIILPNTPEETQKVRDLLAKCGHVLQKINSSIGSKRDSMSTVNARVQDFTRVHTDIKNYVQKADEALCSLQMMLLKEAPHFLDQKKS